MTHRVLLLPALVLLCDGFNLETEKAAIFQENARSFGHSVVQLEGSGFVVGAPQEIKAANQTGGLYQCDYSTGKCEPIHLQLPLEAVNMSLGLSLAFATKPFRLLACGPTVHQTCKENTYVNGLCFLFGPNLRQQPQSFPEKIRECPRQDSDIAFLIDGSGSINPIDFQRMKEFVSTVMDRFKNSKTLFSLMQFSEEFQTHFTFNKFKENPNPQLLVNPIRQLYGRTHTATGILKVVRELFHSSSGARENALKILVVITDGEKFDDPLDYKDVIPEADREGIIRYVIGVGEAFNNLKHREELNTIASKPPRDHVFRVNNFEALKTIQNQLQEKIFAIEGGGTQSGGTSSFEHEMSQEGFSAAITSNGVLLGAVGSFDWAGGAFLHVSKDKFTFINTTRIDSDMNDAYLGYAAEVILRSRVQNLVLGAPRYQHIGLVIMFRENAGTWEATSVIKGSQIGSYFGASLCSVDINKDGSSDLVLIGAPHYYDQTRGGQVSVCPLPRGKAKWQCGAVLRGEQGHPWGRFGAAMTVLGDVNGDKLTDVAIGAPGEQENQGAVYLFHGTSGPGISQSHSQRIQGSQVSPGLQYFGQSLSGGQDLTMDGLVDLAIGAQGRVMLLRSQPVLSLEVTMEFIPKEVARSVFECHEKVEKGQIAGEVKVCLRVRKNTRDRLGEGEIQSTVTYDLALDPSLPHPRVVFDESKNSTRRQTRILKLNRECETLKLLLVYCVEDSVTPIILHFNFSLMGEPLSSFKDLQPVLAVDAQRHFTALFPFEQNCGNDSICHDDLSITFTFMGLDTLVVGGPRDFNVTLTVRNQGEDSYRTQVTIFYPPGLSYRRVSVAQKPLSWRRWRLTCESDDSTNGPEGLKNSSCSIHHPIFPDSSEVTFNITFGVESDASFGNRILLKANVTSENNTTRTNKTEFQLELPVKYTVFAVVTSHEVSTKYLSFIAEEKTSHSIEHKYEFNNLGQRSFPISVVFWVPTKLNNVTVWDNPQLSFSKNLSSTCHTEERDPLLSDFLLELEKTPVVNCSVAVCQRIQCDILSFDIQEKVNITLQGKLSFDWFIKTSINYVQVVSKAEVSFDNSKFAVLPGQEAFLKAQTETKVELKEVHNPLPLIVGSSVGGLVLLALITAALYKLGFFKRQYKDMMSEAGPEAAQPQPQ
ncbi:integrin alpha-M isoform X1 [Ursus maritimus]|uniref:Integrin alpha-M isoform X1 n=1 Tax=Ursus maritimus TaxID=29073 RepID=A0A384BLW3_URSMA|nr:integrin alpha-M isoform X1 [Ursus maritimus]XP_008683562.1 integrin alpha-M isoform X1 [Ursus maritimus]